MKRFLTTTIYWKAKSRITAFTSAWPNTPLMSAAFEFRVRSAVNGVSSGNETVRAATRAAINVYGFGRQRSQGMKNRRCLRTDYDPPDPGKSHEEFFENEIHGHAPNHHYPRLRADI